jgi:hypothetical protein
MSIYQDERDHVARLLELLAISPDMLVDPKSEFREETGVDVIARIGGKKIGIQVTEYNPDFGLPKPPRKQSRAEEKQAASKNSRGYGFSVSGQYIDALRKTISNKLTKTFSSVDEGWLLIAAQNPNLGSKSSTLVEADHISVNRMNAEFHSLLLGRQFANVFLLLAVEQVLFEWSPARQWQRRIDWRTPLDPERVAALRKRLRLTER